MRTRSFLRFTILIALFEAIVLAASLPATPVYAGELEYVEFSVSTLAELEENVGVKFKYTADLLWDGEPPYDAHIRLMEEGHSSALETADVEIECGNPGFPGTFSCSCGYPNFSFCNFDGGYYFPSAFHDLRLSDLVYDDDGDGIVRLYVEVEVEDFGFNTKLSSQTTEVVVAPDTPNLQSPGNGTVSSGQYFSWYPARAARSYQLMVADNDLFNSPLVDASTLNTDYTLGSPLPVGTYWWRLRACNAAACSDWSEVWHFSVLPPLCDPPYLQGSSHLDDWIDLSWDSDCETVEAFWIYRYGDWIGSAYGWEREYRDYPSCGSTYSYEVRAVNAAGPSGPSNTVDVEFPCAGTCYALTRSHTGSGSDPVASPASSSGCPTGQYHAGELIQLTANPSSGWHVGSWSGTNNDASTSTTNWVTMPASNRTVTVNYVEDTVNTPPTLSGLPDRTLNEDTSLDNTIDLWVYASDNETPDSGLSYTIDNSPDPNAGVAVDPNDYIDINPTANWCGWTDVRIRVTDPGGLWDTDTFRVTVNCLNDLPWISPTVPDQSEAQDQPITIDLTAYEHDVEDSGTALDWYVTDEFNCTVSGEYSDNDVLIFTPEPDFVGSETVTLHLVDSGGAEDTQYVTLTWSSTNTPPTLSGLPDRTLNEDTSLDNTIDLWAYASDNETPDSGLSYTIDNSPDPNAGVTVDPNDYIDINPTANWCGWTDVTIRVTDPGGLWDTDTFRVTVNCLNDLPWISPTVPDQSEAQDQPITIDLTAYEHDVEDSGTALDWYVTGEDHCTVSGEYSDDDVLTFTPDAGFAGSDTVTLHLVDSGGAEDTQDVTLTWSSFGTPPTLSGLPDRTLDEGTSLDNTIDLWAYTSDAETPDSGLAYTIDNTPSAGAGVTIDSNRYIDVNPTANWCGWTDITIRVTDPGGLWDTDTFRVTVNCVNDPPNTPSAPNPADGATGVSITADLSWTGGDADAGDTVTYDVYFEANDSTPDNLICSDVSTPACDPGTLAYDTHYYWYVVATDNHGASTTGDTWDFYTSSEPLVCEPLLQLFEPQVCGDHVTINGVVTPQPGCPAIARIHWDWGDGQEHDSWFPAEHTYGALGTYLVTVTAYDLEGHTAVQTTQVDIVTLPIELYYDDGQVDAAWATGPLGGAAVLFTPPEVPWLLSRIKVAGWYAYSDAPFYVEIWDSDRNELLHESYMYSQFFGYEALTWAEIDIPDVVVDGDFYVCVFPNDSEDHILWLGFDNDPPISYHSYDVRYDTNSIGCSCSRLPFLLRASGKSISW